MTAVGQRIYRTQDGRHVAEGDPDAAFLAYSEHDAPPADVLEQLAGPKEKATPPAPNKMRRPAANKNA